MNSRSRCWLRVLPWRWPDPERRRSTESSAGVPCTQRLEGFRGSMNQAVSFLLQHGFWVVFACVLAEQMGLPVAAEPVLLAMAALAGAGKLSFLTAAALAVVSYPVIDNGWYLRGRTVV